MNEQKIGIIIQARMGSSRLPGKSLTMVGNHPLLWYQIQRLKKIQKPCEIILATSDLQIDDPLEKFAVENDIKFFRGSENDVLKRFYDCARKYDLDIIIRITGDCPLIEPKLVEQGIEIFLNGDYNFVGNTHPATFPHGLDFEILSFSDLEYCFKTNTNKNEREHVTLYIWANPQKFKLYNIENEKDLSNYRLTIDYKEDLELFSKLVDFFGDSIIDKDYLEIIDYLDKHPEIKKINSQHIKINVYHKNLKEETYNK